MLASKHYGMLETEGKRLTIYSINNMSYFQSKFIWENIKREKILKYFYGKILRDPKD
jgi:hypothetical protein